MKAEDLRTVQAEMARFQLRLRAVLAKYKAEGERIFSGCAETAALRRASLDLSKTLAQLRRGDLHE